MQNQDTFVSGAQSVDVISEETIEVESKKKSMSRMNQSSASKEKNVRNLPEASPAAAEFQEMTYTGVTKLEEVQHVDYRPIINDEFDDQFDELIDILQTEVKERNKDILLDDESPTEVIEETNEVIDQETVEQVLTEEREPPKEDPGSKTLFNGSPYTLGVIVLLVCAFIIRFRLPDEATAYILRICVCILPQGHRLMGTMYHFRKFLQEYTSKMMPKLYYFCNYCYFEVNRNCKKCPSCSKSLNESSSVAYFVQLKIVSQLMLLWKNSVFATAVRSYRFKHYESKKDKSSISDIYDGEIYKNLYDNDGILSDKNNLSFALNTDGVPLFKSSSIGLWPVYLLINELPVSLRKQRDFSIFYGAWISSRKPQMWSFLKPLYEELKLLESEGCECSDGSGVKFLSKCVLLTCTCDLPARALVYNSIQFNGRYSCYAPLRRRGGILFC